MPFQKGHKFGHRFNSDNQPENKGMVKGTRKRGTITKEIFEMVGVLPDKTFEKMKAIYPEIEKSMSIEKIIDIVQAYKAITLCDTQAAKYLKDNVYGKDVEVENNTTINISIE